MYSGSKPSDVTIYNELPQSDALLNQIFTIRYNIKNKFDSYAIISPLSVPN